MNTYGVILAAGEGTRMRSPLPKVCHPILGKPLLLWVVDAVKQAGIEKPTVVLGARAEQVSSLFSQNEVTQIIQQERKGTGHALQVALGELSLTDGALLVMYGDTPLVTSKTLEGLLNCIRENKAQGALLTFFPKNPSGYGRVVTNEAGQIQEIIEDKDCTPKQRKQLTECNSGIYAFDVRTLLAHIDKLDNHNASGECYITDLVKLFTEAGQLFQAYASEDEDEVQGVNSQAQLAEATKAAQARINSQLMDAGVSMLDPNFVWVGPDVTVEAGSFLQPMTFLYGTTSIGAESTIGPFATLVDTTIGAHSFAGNNTRLTRVIAKDGCSLDETVALDATLEVGATAGPRAYLRPGTHLLAHAKAGTHVELKNSTIGEHSAVPHLSYIGDTTMGAFTNVGAGSITCNYNGKEKNKTSIGSDCFIGSNTMMVAPVQIGDGVITGAGSVITEQVPEGALGLGRARQTNIEGYRKKSGLPYKSNQANSNKKG